MRVGRADDAAVDEGVDRGRGLRRPRDERVVLEVAVFIIIRSLDGRAVSTKRGRAGRRRRQHLGDLGLGRRVGRAPLLEVLPRAGPGVQPYSRAPDRSQSSRRQRLGRLGPLRREDVAFVIDCSETRAVVADFGFEVAALDLCGNQPVSREATFDFYAALDLDAAHDHGLAREVLGHLDGVVGRRGPVERRRRRTRFPRVIVVAGDVGAVAAAVAAQQPRKPLVHAFFYCPARFSRGVDGGFRRAGLPQGFRLSTSVDERKDELTVLGGPRSPLGGRLARGLGVLARRRQGAAQAVEQGVAVGVELHLK
mmetsp:Transcript_9038/g.26337  ORF Transcript_9038/g.26337 Transcript_9038/m.26337 type:complete len:309 (+) Transcript_9038:539-1465(+)